MEQVNSLAGEVAALKLAVIALMQTAPHPNAVRTALSRHAEALSTSLLFAAYPDGAQEAMERTVEVLLRHSLLPLDPAPPMA